MKNIISQLDKAFDNRIRLGAMSILMVNPKASFNELKEMLEVTDGNLATHLKLLETVGYLQVNKGFLGRKPYTTYEITPPGRSAFEIHLKALEAIINQQ